MVLLLALAAAADGDQVGGVVMGQTADLSSYECRENSCQKRGNVGGHNGTWAVKHCGGVVTGATFLVTFVPNTGVAANHFQNIATHVSNPEADAHVVQQQWVEALHGSGWQTHTEEQEAGGSEWIRLVSTPHARLIRVRSRDVAGVIAFTVSMVASATDPSCPRP
ncbi:MAG: hypothetical protein ACJATT_002946 [Myxococcota bacterium]|jgi:hypothetical protein